MAQMKTPGVYIQEKNAFPNSVVPVDTAIPGFVGYTEKASFKGQSLLNKPVQVNSYNEFVQFFGAGYKTTYSLTDFDTSLPDAPEPDLHMDDKAYLVESDAGTKFNMFDAMKFFYQNGGGICFIVAVGTYGGDAISPAVSATPFEGGIKILEKETVPTMLLVPDSVLLPEDVCYSLQKTMLTHCGKQRNRVAILDLYGGDKGLDDPSYNPVDKFRDNVKSEFLAFGAAYYPWLNTTITQNTEVNFTSLNKASVTLLKTNCQALLDGLNDAKKTALQPFIDQLGTELEDVEVKELNIALSSTFPNYQLIMDAVLKKINLLPPAAAMAGIYTSVDNNRGVWKAPANVAVNSVVSPAVLIDNQQQENLNDPIFGKSINAIRPFVGLGIMVWGARTLDSNSLDWRYINVRRTMIMIEQSIKFASEAYIFEPNVKNTWVSIEAMISNFLTNVWNQGALAGASPQEAFQVIVGLGKSMTSVDILEGKMNIVVKVAISRPAEFIVITFQQQMQKS